MTLKAWCNEPLEDHLLRVGDVAFGSAGEEAMVREVRSVHTAVAKRLGIDVEAARRLVAVAAYLHDVGKAAEPYQRIIMLREREGCRGLSLPGHEAWSAWVAYYTIRPLGDKLARVASAAIILHHMPRWSIEDIVTTASKIRPTLGDVDTMFTLAERGFRSNATAWSTTLPPTPWRATTTSASATWSSCCRGLSCQQRRWRRPSC